MQFEASHYNDAKISADNKADQDSEPQHNFKHLRFKYKYIQKNSVYTVYAVTIFKVRRI